MMENFVAMFWITVTFLAIIAIAVPVANWWEKRQK